MTITTEEWMQHRRDGLKDALVDRGYPKGWVGVRNDDGWFTLAITRHLGDHPFVAEGRDLSQAYRDGLAYINSLPQMEQANMPWVVYRCDPIALGEAPQNEVPVSGHMTASDAFDEANRLKREDRGHSYTVGAA